MFERESRQGLVGTDTAKGLIGSLADRQGIVYLQTDCVSKRERVIDTLISLTRSESGTKIHPADTPCIRPDPMSLRSVFRYGGQAVPVLCQSVGMEGKLFLYCVSL